MKVYPLAGLGQWYADDFPGRIFDTIEKLCLHTTEGSGWPDYRGGRDAPNFTAYPDTQRRKLVWREHFPVNMSSRALVNARGGVETNTDNTVQVELVGTCDPGQSARMFYWPAAPDWALDELSKFVAWLHTQHGLALAAPALWLPYPSSYGNSRARLHGKAYDNFRGILGHQHVDENDHGDPGDFPIARLIHLTLNRVGDPGTTELEDDMVDAAQEDRIAQKAAAEVWNRFLVPDDGVPNTHFRDALGEILDNTQDTTAKVNTLVDIVTKQQAQLTDLANAVKALVGK